MVIPPPAPATPGYKSLPGFISYRIPLGIYRIAQQYLAFTLVGEAFRLPRDGKPVPYTLIRAVIDPPGIYIYRIPTGIFVCAGATIVHEITIMSKEQRKFPKQNV